MMTNEINHHTYFKFDKEYNKFFKKCPSLENDFNRLVITLKTQIKENEGKVPNLPLYPKIPKNKFNIRINYPLFKVKRFYCEKYNKCVNSGFRLIFMYIPELSLIYFIEMYHKNKKPDMDFDRPVCACDYLNNLLSEYDENININNITYFFLLFFIFIILVLQKRYFLMIDFIFGINTKIKLIILLLYSYLL